MGREREVGWLRVNRFTAERRPVAIETLFEAPIN